MRISYAWLAAALLALGTAGCHGGSSSPTELSGSYRFSFSAEMSNTLGQYSIGDAQVLVDKVEVADSCPPGAMENQYDANGNVVSFHCTAGRMSTATFSATDPIGPGTHTMRFLIVEHSTGSTASTYRVQAFDIKVTDISGNPVKTISLPTQTAALAAGQAISYSFTI